MNQGVNELSVAGTTVSLVKGRMLQSMTDAQPGSVSYLFEILNHIIVQSNFASRFLYPRIYHVWRCQAG